MKFWMLVWAGLSRHRARSVLTMLSIIIAFLLFGLLQGLGTGLTDIATRIDGQRLFSANRYNALEGLPLAHRHRIGAVPGVTSVVPWVYFGGFYQDRRNALGVFATDIPTLFELYPEFRLRAGRLDALTKNRRAAWITTQLAARYGWRVGDRVPVGTSMWTDHDGRSDYVFEIAGIYDRGNAPVNGFLIDFEYLDAARRAGGGTTHYYVIGVADPSRADAVANAIDSLFANSAAPTRTQTEQAYLATTLKQLADIDFIVRAIVGAVFFALLFVTGTTMMQSVRERIPELAVLQAIGFSAPRLAALVVVEAACLCLTSALLGLALAQLVFVPLGAMFSLGTLPHAVVVQGLAAALLLAVVSALPPALRTGRLTIVEALAGRP